MIFKKKIKGNFKLNVTFRKWLLLYLTSATRDRKSILFQEASKSSQNNISFLVLYYLIKFTQTY